MYSIILFPSLHRLNQEKTSPHNLIIIYQFTSHNNYWRTFFNSRTPMGREKYENQSSKKATNFHSVVSIGD